jgi:BA14K-like protein
LIVGGAIAASQPWGGYGYYDSYGYGPGYGYGNAPAQGYAYAPGPGYATGYEDGNDVAYCQQRFRSYDPSSGTYMGYDGLRHSCP